jgi:hypothetical protein
LLLVETCPPGACNVVRSGRFSNAILRTSEMRRPAGMEAANPAYHLSFNERRN